MKKPFILLISSLFCCLALISLAQQLTIKSQVALSTGFLQHSGTDMLVFNYNVLALPVSTKITLLFEVVNENAISYARTYGFEIA